MTSTMKFNRKVFVVPEEKYLSMQENSKLREEVDRNSDHPLPSHRRMDVEGSSTDPNFSSGVNELVARSETNSPEKNELRPSQDILNRALKRLKEDSHKRHVITIYHLLESCHPSLFLWRESTKGHTSEEEEEKKKEAQNLVNLMLHTQSAAYLPPDNCREFYSYLLDCQVPLRLISNHRLRRVLHYMKNIRSEEEEEEDDDHDDIIIKRTKKKKNDREKELIKHSKVVKKKETQEKKFKKHKHLDKPAVWPKSKSWIKL